MTVVVLSMVLIGMMVVRMASGGDHGDGHDGGLMVMVKMVSMVMMRLRW